LRWMIERGAPERGFSFFFLSFNLNFLWVRKVCVLCVRHRLVEIATCSFLSKGEKSKIFNFFVIFKSRKSNIFNF
jgi:hypothetical protein